MSNGGSEAVRLDYMQTANTREQRVAAPSWEVIPGGGLDARARRGVSPEFVRGLRLAVAFVLAFTLVGGARVALSSATVSALEATQTLQSKVSEAQDTNDALQIERSVDASSQRIVRIATENYGMVRASSVDDVALVPMPTAAELAENELKASDTDRVASMSATGIAAMDKFVSREPVWDAEDAAAPAEGSSDAADAADAQTQDQSDTVDPAALEPENAGANAVAADSL